MTDPLDRFSAALAAEHDGQVALPGVTRTRIAEGLLRRRARRSGWRAFFLVPLLILAGGTALAATGHLPRSLAAAMRWFEGESPADSAQKVALDQAASPRSATTQAPRSIKSSTPPEVTDLSSLEVAAEAEAVGNPSATSRAASSRPASSRAADSRPASSHSSASQAAASSSVASRSASSRAVASGFAASGSAGSRPAGSRSVASRSSASRGADRELTGHEPGLATYASAQRAQFHSADCAAAIRLYEDYLARAPSGALVAEARYNRSLCLIRLGRITEARRALDAFADGEFGDYRRSEATRLLAATED